MSEPDIQYFAESGTWHKPAGAVRVDYLICAAGGGGSSDHDGESGELRAESFAATEIPDEVQVTVGKGGRGAPGAGDGADGYVLILTHLT